MQEDTSTDSTYTDYNKCPCYNDAVASEFIACCVELVFVID